MQNRVPNSASPSTEFNIFEYRIRQYRVPNSAIPPNRRIHLKTSAAGQSVEGSFEPGDKNNKPDRKIEIPHLL